MPVTLNAGRQYKLVAEIAVNLADLASGVAQDVIKLPAGSVIHGGRIYTDTAFNSGTSDTLSVGDSVLGTRYFNANTTVLRTAGTTAEFAVAANGYKYSASNAIRLTWTGAGTAATTGSARLYVEYSVDGKALEVQA